MFIKNNTQYLSATSGRSNQSQHGLRVASECVYSSVQQGGNRLQHIQKHRDIKGTGHKIKIMKIQTVSPHSPQNLIKNRETTKESSAGSTLCITFGLKNGVKNVFLNQM